MPQKFISTSKFINILQQLLIVVNVCVYFLSRVGLLIDSCLERYNWFDWNNTGKMVLPDSTHKYIAANRDKDMEAATKVGGHH